MVATLKFHGKKFGEWCNDRLYRGLRAAGFELHRISQLYASIPNPGEKRKRTRSTSRGAKGTQYTVYPHSSQPEESPRMRTGFGRRNIVWAADRAAMVARVGYTRNARYMIYHEVGIRYRLKGKQKRPTIVPALRENEQRLEGIFERAAKR